LILSHTSLVLGYGRLMEVRQAKPAASIKHLQTFTRKGLLPDISFFQRLRRIAARLRATAIRKVNAKSVLHMAKSPHWHRAIGFLFCDFFWMRHHHRRRHTREPEVDCYHFDEAAKPTQR
jgi:hypothetical protein